MGLMDILDKYSNQTTAADPNAAHTHFDEVATAAPKDVLGQGVGDAFRADTPSFGEMVSATGR